MHSEPDTPIDIAHLNQFRDRPVELQAFVRSLLTEGPDLLQDLKACVDGGDGERLKDLLHQLAGMATNTGAKALRARCLRLAADWGPYSLPQGIPLEPLVAEFAVARDALERFLNTLSTDGLITAPSTSPSYTVLLIEDNESTRLLARMVLGGHCTLLEAANGREALELAQCRSPDLAIVDLNLGRASADSPSGVHLLRRLKNWIPALVLTIDQREESIRRAANAGAWGYLVKTPDLQNLRPAVDMLLARSVEIQKAATANVIAIATGWIMATYRVNQEVANQILLGYAAKERCRPADFARDLLDTQRIFNSIGAYINEFIDASVDLKA